MLTNTTTHLFKFIFIMTILPIFFGYGMEMEEVKVNVKDNKKEVHKVIVINNDNIDFEFAVIEPVKTIPDPKISMKQLHEQRKYMREARLVAKREAREKAKLQNESLATKKLIEEVDIGRIEVLIHLANKLKMKARENEVKQLMHEKSQKMRLAVKGEESDEEIDVNEFLNQQLALIEIFERGDEIDQVVVMKLFAEIAKGVTLKKTSALPPKEKEECEEYVDHNQVAINSVLTKTQSFLKTKHNDNNADNDKEWE